jgi:hypothetical protein
MSLEDLSVGDGKDLVEVVYVSPIVVNPQWILDQQLKPHLYLIHLLNIILY